jgi:hypothetical protein
VKAELLCEIGTRLDSLLRETQKMLDETKALLVSSDTQLEGAQQALSEKYERRAREFSDL